MGVAAAGRSRLLLETEGVVEPAAKRRPERVQRALLQIVDDRVHEGAHVLAAEAELADELAAA